MKKIKVGISSCLLGENVRYDASHKHDRYLTDTLGKFFEWVGVCPEVECGLGVPRESMHLEGDPENPRLVTDHTKVDHTDHILKWAEKKLIELEGQRLAGFIFKNRSPNCEAGRGIFANQFIRRFMYLPVENEDRLCDPNIMRDFIEKVSDCAARR